MTTTAVAPRARSAPATESGLRSYVVPSEAGLVLLTLATVVGFSRVFSSWSFLGPMVAIALYTHGVCMITRRRGLSVPVSGLIAVAGFLLLSSWVFFFDATTMGIPTSSTLGAARDALTASWDTFQTVVAPAPALPGFVMASCAALFFAVFLADWAGFRLWSAFEAIVPASTLFIFCSLLGSNQFQVVAATIFLAALFVFLLFHRIARQETAAGWLTADIARGSNSLAVTGLALTAVAVLIGGVVAPRLPGADSPALISWRGQEAGPGSRTTISPLVDIQDRLTNQSNVELFTVQSNERAYWRMTSLDSFEGDIWKSSGKYTSVEGELDSAPTQGAKADVRQTFTIENLRVLWLPAAYEPASVDSPAADVRYQEDSSTLIVDTSVADSDGMSYVVDSKIPRLTEADLKGTAGTMPEDIKNRYLALPPTFSPVARDIALDQTRGATDPYTKARLLQDYFQNNFTYDLHVPRGHSTNAIEEFLRDKRGYCEQFAGTYAAMARSIGLPARVAVGFTPGDGAGPTYQVRGEHAHAWPEVYLGQFGWVAFEPTPGRGAPFAEAYTGLPEKQDTSGPVEAPTTAVNSTVAPSTVTTLVPSPAGTAPAALDTGLTPDTTATDEGRSWFVSFLLFVVALLALAVVLLASYGAAITLLKQARHQRRRERATDPNARVRVAWDESIEALGMLDTQPAPSETHEEFAQRAGARLDTAAPSFVGLAHDVDAASYAPDYLSDDVADRAHRVSAAVISAVNAQTTTSRQWRQRLDPRPLLPERGPSRHRAGSAH